MSETPSDAETMRLLEAEGDRLLNANAEILREVAGDVEIRENFASNQPIKTGLFDETPPPPLENPTKEGETYYLNLPDFVESYLAKVFACNTTPAAKRIWLSDWWEYPAIVGRLQPLWTSWELAHKNGTLETWFLQVGDPMMNRLMDKEDGIMSHYVKENNVNVVEVQKGQYLPTTVASKYWLEKVAYPARSIHKQYLLNQKLSAAYAQRQRERDEEIQ